MNIQSQLSFINQRMNELSENVQTPLLSTSNLIENNSNVIRQKLSNSLLSNKSKTSSDTSLVINNRRSNKTQSRSRVSENDKQEKTGD